MAGPINGKQDKMGDLKIEKLFTATDAMSSLLVRSFGEHFNGGGDFSKGQFIPYSSMGRVRMTGRTSAMVGLQSRPRV